MTEMTHFYIFLAGCLFSGGLGFYMGGRGMAGVKIDLDNTKNEIEKVKTLVKAKTTTIVTPLKGSKTSDTGTVTITSSK